MTYENGVLWARLYGFWIGLENVRVSADIRAMRVDGKCLHTPCNGFAQRATARWRVWKGRVPYAVGKRLPKGFVFRAKAICPSLIAVFRPLFIAVKRRYLSIV